MEKQSRREKRKEVKGPVLEQKGIQPVRSGRYSPAIVFFIIALTVLFSAYNRNHVWKDEETVWEDVTRKSSGKARGHNNLGAAYNKHERMDEAIEELILALRLKPDFPEAHNNLGAAYSNLGRTDEAIEEYRSAIRLDPNAEKA
jgi:tetratricopeptide (TPR) repeat protein